MVRALVGACVAVGEGRLPPGEPVALRAALVRTQAFKVMPAKGLTLVEVGYPADDELTARAERTRGLRELAEQPGPGSATIVRRSAPRAEIE